MQSEAYRYILWLWSAVGIVWLAGSVTAKRAARVEAAGTRAAHMALTVLAFTLVFTERAGIGPLGWRFVPASAAIEWAGFVLTFAGCAFAIWARFMLGGNWSGSVTVKHDHQLVLRGPYLLVRHPIYSGALLGLLGAAITVGEVRGLAGFAIAFYAWLMKSRMEEAFMTEQFGSQYTQYRQRVKAIIPFIL